MGIQDIPYEDDAVMRVLGAEAERELGVTLWGEIAEGLTMPSEQMPPEDASRATRRLLERMGKRAEVGRIQRILAKVAHGLTPGDFAWAREEFLQCGNIDTFAAAVQAQIIGEIENSLSGDRLFFGQPVDEAVVDFIKSDPYIFYGTRVGADIYATVFPFDPILYLRETDPRKKRYHACHCHYARESILQEEGPVSSCLCYCSLGHTKVFWEAALDTALEGEVLESALGGALRCRFVIHLPDEILRHYT
jgi:hypothetical protein